MANLSGLSQAVIDADWETVDELVRQALEEGARPEEIVSEGLIKGMQVVGDLFKRDELFVPEVLACARAMKAGMDILEPLISGGEKKAIGIVLLGTVKGDLHDIGKNLVKMMLEGAGFKVIDLGINVPVETFVSKAAEIKPDIVGMSALLTTTMSAMKQTIDALEEAGIRKGFKVMVGGAPVTQAFADEIGADGWAQDAGASVDTAKSLLAQAVA